MEANTPQIYSDQHRNWFSHSQLNDTVDTNTPQVYIDQHHDSFIQSLPNNDVMLNTQIYNDHIIIAGSTTQCKTVILALAFWVEKLAYIYNYKMKTQMTIQMYGSL